MKIYKTSGNILSNLPKNKIPICYVKLTPLYTSGYTVNKLRNRGLYNKYTFEIILQKK